MDQPRVPGGSPEGGQFASKLGSARASMESAGDVDAQKAVARYTQAGYARINGHLRGNWVQRSPEDEKDVQKFIDDLDGAFKNHGTTLDEDIVVHRGINSSQGAQRFDIPQGTVFEDQGFVSTSITKDASFFTRGIGLEILVPKGTRVLSLIDDAEKEVLLPRGSRFEVVSKTTEEGKTVLHGEVHKGRTVYKVRLLE